MSLKIRIENKKVQTAVALGLGALVSVGFAPLYWWPVAFSAWSVFLYILLTRPVCGWLFSFAFGFGTGAVSMAWIVHALAIENGMFLWATPFAILGFGLLFGIFAGLAALPLLKITSIVRRLFAFAAAWTLMEMLRAVFLTGFPWNLLGSIWVDTPAVLQMAAVGGVYLLSFWSIIVFGLPVLFATKKRGLAYSIICVALLCVALGQMRLVNAQENALTGIKVRLVQPNIPQVLKWKKDEAEASFLKLIRLSRSDSSVSHVLWPEASTQFLLPNDKGARAMTMQALKQGQILIAGTLRKTETNDYANSIVILDDLGNVKGIYDKAHLVPFGEFMPLSEWLPWQKLVQVGEDIQAGSSIKTLRVPNAPAAGFLLCYEGIFPKQVVQKGTQPQWLLIATNDAWFGNSAGPYQHLAAAQLRAVEEGLPVVRVANSGISAVIDPYGRILASLPLDTEGALNSTLPLALEGATPFAHCPLYIYVFIGLAILLGTLYTTKSSRL